MFDSEDEDEDESTSRPEQPPTNLKKSLFEHDSGSDEDQQTSMLKEKANMDQDWIFSWTLWFALHVSIIIPQKNNKPGGSKLFDSEDEDDGSEDDRFQIKPQFEGKAGQKVWIESLYQDGEIQRLFDFSFICLHLYFSSWSFRPNLEPIQDSRLILDFWKAMMSLKIKVIYLTMFLGLNVFERIIHLFLIFQISDEAAPEKDADKQLLEEKKKSLDILQSILNTDIQPQNTRKGKMFKYDFFRCSLSMFCSFHLFFLKIYVPCLALQRCFEPALRPDTRRTHCFWG